MGPEGPVLAVPGASAGTAGVAEADRVPKGEAAAVDAVLAALTSALTPET